MKKLSGGSVLECGHEQHISERRQIIAKAGQQQPSVWCLECQDWSVVLPVSIPEPERRDN